MTTLIRKAIYTREDEESLIINGDGWNFHDEETKEPLHTLHPYPAKFIPQIPRKAIKLWTKRGDLVYDPFSGCGTTVLEASLAGRYCIGTDNNAVANLIARAKTAIYSQEDIIALHRFTNNISNGLGSAPLRPELIPANKNFHYWFDPITVTRLAALKGLILAEKEPLKTLLLAIFSSIIVRVSYQDSDTRYARKRRNVTPDEVDSTFYSRLSSIITQLKTVLVLNRTPVEIIQADARHVDFIKNLSVSLIVTSPPYLNAYDYHKYHRQRLHWICDDDNIKFARDNEIGSHDKFTRKNATPDDYFYDMDVCFNEWKRVLKIGGRCLIVIGDAIVSKNPVNVADSFIDMLINKGFSIKNRWIRTIKSTQRSFNVKNSRISHEHVILAVKN